jgi:hypothetical protein
LSGALKATDALGSTCVGAWAEGVLGPACQVLASKSHKSCCSHRKTKPSDSGCSGACLPRHGLHLDSTIVLQGGFKPSGSSCPGACLLAQATRSCGSCCRHRKLKLVDSGSSGACLPGAGFQEPQELQQLWEYKACGQWEPWCLLAGTSSQEP